MRRSLHTRGRTPSTEGSKPGRSTAFSSIQGSRQRLPSFLGEYSQPVRLGRRAAGALATSDTFEERLRRWSFAAYVEAPLPGGARGDVRAVRIGGRRYVARQSLRPGPALLWEIDLLRHLFDCGIRVPVPLEAKDGSMHIDGFTVMDWLDGDPPRTAREWKEAALALGRVHAATRGRTQRPGFASSIELVTRDAGGDVDLSFMPAEVVTLVRSAWRPLSACETSVVHGDPHAGNIRISAQGVGLIDWDEARVDASILDFSDLPDDAAPSMPKGCLETARIAADAWETASCWILEPAYARRRLQSLQARVHSS
jgi:aminoglycoside phosphotransferase (APT) family kinase protein